MANKNNSNDYKKIVESVNLDPMSRHNLVIPDHEETIKELVEAGERLLIEEQKTNKVVSSKDDNKKLETKLALASDNPYIRAWGEVLNKWMNDPKTLREAKEIENMEKGKFPRDRYYNDFIKEVITLGDSISK